VRPQRFAAPAILCLGLALSATGCGGGHRRQGPAARSLSIYTSLPFEGPYAAQAAAIFDGEKLALAQAGGVVNGFKVTLRKYDDAGSSVGSTTTLVGENARIAAADRSTIAYIGELTPGSSLGSIEVLSQLGVLQVSPGDTATGLAGRTFARVVPPDSAEADAQLHAMKKLGVRTLYLLEDRTTYGRDIAAAALSDAANYGIGVVDGAGKYVQGDTRALVKAIRKSKADGLLYAGSPSGSVPTLWNAVTASDGTIKKFASAAIASAPSWAQTSPSARYNTYLSAPGLPTAKLPRAGSQFETDFAAAYGNHVPWMSGIFGYVAMTGVLEAMHRLGPFAKYRAEVASAFLHTANLPSALGTYTITGGQTSFQRYVFTSYYRDGSAMSFVQGVD
jgi:branched-chain amino acid transport system substrate-binding protein